MDYAPFPMDIPSLCVQCGAALPAQARFCPQCGARVAALASATVPASKASGERRQVAILFADLSGYTRLSRTQDPEETHTLLTRYFELVDVVIEEFGGTIDKHIGDAVMGVFGAPIAYGNDVERAMRAAVSIHEGMARLSAETGVVLGTHIGIASGEVVAGETGSVARHDYTVTGDAVNLAARLTDLASTGETVVSTEVHLASTAFAATAPLGSVPIRGLAEPVRAFKLTALHARAAGAPLVGRDAQRQRFSALIADAARSGTGAIALLRGDPGMGKSRLAEALLADATAAGVQCHASAVLDFGVARGQDAMQALVASLLDVRATDSEVSRCSALQQAVADGRAESDDEPYLADLLMLPQRTGSLYDAIDAEARRAGKLRALASVVERAARAQPCMLLVDDVHWGSEWVLACLRELAPLVTRAPVALTMTTRRDGDPITGRWPDETVVRFDLTPLAHEDALALARLHLSSTPDIAQRCVERAQGNPLFLMQLLRNGSDEEAIPATIQSVVLARLDRLSSKDKAAMQAAAVVGLRFPIELLRHLVDDALYEPTNPVARDLLRHDQRDPRFVLFTHALIRDGAYASLLHASRRALHVKAAHWYETRDPTLSAQHLDRADDPRAPEAYLTAARAETAAMRTETALALAARGGELAAEPEVRFALATLVGELHAELGRARESISAFEHALSVATDARQRATAWIGIASGHRMESGVPQGLAALDAAEAHAAGSALVRERARIAYLRGSLHFAAGNAAECRRYHEQARELARAAGDAECEAQALSGLADALYAQGKLRSAHSAFIRCLDICERLGLTRFSLMNHCMVAIIDALLAEMDQAIARLDRARGIARDVRYRFAEAMCDEVAGWVLVLAGRYQDAVEPVTRGIPIARAAGARRFEPVLLAALARIRAFEGAVDAARACVRDAWLVSEDVGHRFAGPLVLAEMAATAANEAERDEALAKGERLLRDGCISHCYVGFYQSAIEVSLAAHKWEAAERYAQLLEDYARDERLPLIEFVVARGRALAAAGQGRADRDALERCRATARALKVPAYGSALDAAVASLATAP